MNYFRIVLCTILLCFSTIIIADDEYANVDPIGQESTYDDFADIEVTLTAEGHYHWSIDVTDKMYWWNGTTYVELYAHDYYHDWPFDNGEYDWSITNLPHQIKNIAYKGDGDFKFGFYVNAGAQDYREITFEVVDTEAPSAPTNLAVTAQNNHPYLTWSANSEEDLEEYDVWRYSSANDPTWRRIATTSNTYYADDDVGTEDPAETIYYKIKAEDYEDNESSFSSQVSISGYVIEGFLAFGLGSFGSNLGITPETYNLAQNYPNPFNPKTKITFGIPEENFVNLIIYNIQGEKVATLVNQQLPAGSYTAKFDGSLLPSGVYIYKIQAGSFSQIKRMLLIK